MYDLAAILKNKGINPYKLLSVSKKNIIDEESLKNKVEMLIEDNPQMTEDILLAEKYIIRAQAYEKNKKLEKSNMITDPNLKEPEEFSFEEYLQKREIKEAPEPLTFMTKNNKFMKSKFNKIFEELYKIPEKEEKVRVDWSSASINPASVIFSDGNYILDKDNSQDLLVLEESGPKIPEGIKMKKGQLTRIMEDFNILSLNKQTMNSRLAVNDFLSSPR